MFNMAVSLIESTKQHDGKIIVIKGRQKCDIFGRWQFSIVELYGQQKILQADAKILLRWRHRTMGAFLTTEQHAANIHCSENKSPKDAMKRWLKAETKPVYSEENQENCEPWRNSHFVQTYNTSTFIYSTYLCKLSARIYDKTGEKRSIFKNVENFWLPIRGPQFFQLID